MDSLNIGSLGRQTLRAGSGNNLATVHNNGMPEPTNLLRFYKSNDDPWTPSNLVKPALANDPSRQVFDISGTQRYYQPAYDFSGYRSVGQPSECGTLPGDSGYGGSRPTCSVESASTINEDDRGFDTQVDHFMSSFHLSTEPQPTPPGGHKHFCEGCNTYLRTQSELNKHIQRHRKPHVCSYPDCARAKEGFSTTNDLQRHKKTVHNEHELGGKKYICNHGNCRRKPSKKWPRADNFRSHLARVHHVQLRPDTDLSPYLDVQSSLQTDIEAVKMTTAFAHVESGPNNSLDPLEIPREHPASQSLSSLGEHAHTPSDESEHISLNNYALHPSLSVNKNDSASPSLREDQMQYIQPNVLQGPPETQLRSHLEQPFMDALQQTDDSNDASLLGTDGRIASMIGTDTQDTSEMSYDDVERTATPTEHMELVEELGTPDSKSYGLCLAGIRPTDPRMLEVLKALPKELLESALKSEAAGGPNTKGQYGCSKCQKHFNRPCELKKHMKRHDKPYGCTFRNCSKGFGSKNDWKRHESTQHFQLETWNCDEQNCRKIFHRRESFKNHLSRDHSIEDAKLFEDKLEKCRMGRHCATEFWCGFCRETVQIEQEGVNWWTKRCDHIDSHLFGKEGLEKKSINEWHHQEAHDALDENQEATGSGHAEQQSSKPSISSNTNKSTDRKRKIRNDLSRRPSKKQARRGTSMWICCICDNMTNVKTSSSCVDCGHQKCEWEKFEDVEHCEDEQDEMKRVEKSKELPPPLERE